MESLAWLPKAQPRLRAFLRLPPGQKHRKRRQRCLKNRKYRPSDVLGKFNNLNFRNNMFTFYGSKNREKEKMLYTPMTKMAMKLCFIAHRDQMDKSGMPYVFHPFHVAEQMTDEETIIVALLHDVVEDTSYTIENLREMGFSEIVLDALTLMTHDDGTPYMDYVAKLRCNPIARKVKLADLRHNSDLTRLDYVDNKSRERVEKYAAAIRMLEDVENEESTIK